MSRRTAAATAAGLMLASGAFVASAEPMNPPETVGAIVGLAWDEATSRLILADERAQEGVLTVLSENGGSEELIWGADDVVSVQALAVHQGQLYIGDIGDEQRARKDVVIYRIRDAEAGEKQFRRFRLTYPDGEARDAKAMMVSAKGNIYIATTGDDPAIFRAPADLPRDVAAPLKRVADAPEGVTDGVFIDGGRAIALRAADGVHVIDAYSWKTKAVETYVGDIEPESITARDDQLLIGGSGDVREAAIPTENTTATPVPEAPSSSEAEGTPSEDDGAVIDDPPIGDTPTNTGTIIALVLAGLVSVIAGITTYLVRG